MAYSIRIKNVVLLSLLQAISLLGIAGETDPKARSEKKDTTKTNQAADLKGFKNLFTGDVFNPAEPYRLQVNPKAVPYIDDYIERHKEYLEGMKLWGQPYFRMMETILAGYGLPKELKYLAVIESNLENSALSWAGARGPWQLMPETARQLGLVVTAYRDERTDYYKSTHAAARYLKTLYQQLNRDWLLVIAGYNGGPGRVLNAIKRTGSKDFWVLQNHLPQESRNHVKKFIGTHYVMEGSGGLTTITAAELATLHKQAAEANNNRISQTMAGVAQLRQDLAPEVLANTQLLKIQGKYAAMILCNQIGVDIAQFNQLNPHFDKLVPEEDGYELRLPADKMELFKAQRYVILQQSILSLLNGVHQGIETYPQAKPTLPVKTGTTGKKK
ncbi:MAG: lytic transglycosylase domain-containing protein [Chitinophagaceae bacterium]|nr:lytic transglycosylase domain-containing protein [Chitinophagaceae bacterium]